MERGRTPISIVGCGPGAAEYLTPAAIVAIMGSDALVGAARLLDLFPDHPGDRFPVTGRIDESLDAIEQGLERGTVACLVSGDPGVFSLSKRIIKRFGFERCRIVPGISSLQIAFARLGLDWADALVISAHGADPDDSAVRVRKSTKTAFFGGRPESLTWLAEALNGPDAADKRLFVMEDLTLETERIREVHARDLQNLDAGSRTIVLVVREDFIP